MCIMARAFNRIPCPYDYPNNCQCNTCKYDRGELGRAANKGKAAYGRGSTSGAYGRGSYNFESATFDGLPALKRRRGDKVDFFYGVGVTDTIDLDDRAHGHAVLRNGRLIYKRLPGQELPILNTGE